MDFIFCGKNHRKLQRCSYSKILAILILVVLIHSLSWSSGISINLLRVALFLFLALKFITRPKNLLNLLLCLEIVTLALLFALLISVRAIVSSPRNVFLFLVLAVCEARLGLRVLVRLGRFCGNELILD